MELAIYLAIFIIIIISISSFWLLGTLYGFFKKPKIYFPMSLAIKMAATAVAGGLLFMVGGLILSTMIFNGEMKKRKDYKFWPTIITGIAISTAGSISIVFLFRYLVWDALQRGI